MIICKVFDSSREVIKEFELNEATQSCSVGSSAQCLITVNGSGVAGHHFSIVSNHESFEVIAASGAVMHNDIDIKRVLLSDLVMIKFGVLSLVAYEKRKDSPFVLLINCPDLGDGQFPVGCNENRVGSALNSHVLLNNSSCSKEHAVIEYSAGKVHLQDCGSTNGTYIGSKKVSSKVLLPPKTLFRLGTLDAVVVEKDELAEYLVTKPFEAKQSLDISRTLIIVAAVFVVLGGAFGAKKYMRAAEQKRVLEEHRRVVVDAAARQEIVENENADNSYRYRLSKKNRENDDRGGSRSGAKVDINLEELILQETINTSMLESFVQAKGSRLKLKDKNIIIYFAQLLQDVKAGRMQNRETPELNMRLMVYSDCLTSIIKGRCILLGRSSSNAGEQRVVIEKLKTFLSNKWLVPIITKYDCKTMIMKLERLSAEERFKVFLGRTLDSAVSEASLDQLSEQIQGIGVLSASNRVAAAAPLERKYRSWMNTILNNKAPFLTLPELSEAVTLNQKFRSVLYPFDNQKAEAISVEIASFLETKENQTNKECDRLYKLCKYGTTPEVSLRKLKKLDNPKSNRIKILSKLK